MILAIDFDGTIVEDRFPDIGNPIPQAFDTILHLQNAGHQLILWTCRENNPARKYLDEAVLFCAERGLHFDAVNANVNESPFQELGQGRKVFADLYVDDKAMFPVWDAYAGGVL